MIEMSLSHLLKVVVMKLIQISVLSSFMIAAVIFIRIIGKRIPKKYMCVLWSLVFLKLISPFNVKTSFSILPLHNQHVGNEYHATEIPLLQTGIGKLDHHYNRIMVNYNAVVEKMRPSTIPVKTTILIVTYVWLIGFIALVTFELIRTLCLKKRLRTAILVEKNIYRSDQIKGAFLMGIFSPKIYLPIDLTLKQQEYVILHEQTHVRRRDYILKVIVFLIVAIHWFNPLAWIAFSMMSKDIEMAVDEQICLPMEKPKRLDYANTLFSLSCKGQYVPITAFGVNPVTNRIRHVLTLQPDKKVNALVTIILAVIVALCLGTCRIIPS